MSRLRRICSLIAAVLLAGCAAAPAGAAAPPLGSSRDVMVAVRTRDNYGAQVVETALGSLAADALRECAGADIAIVSGGHFAWNLDGGPVTEADVRSILPDGHETAVLEVTAAQLRHILELAVSRTAIGEDECIDPDASAFAAFPQIAGFSFTYDASQRPGGRVRDIRLDGGDAPLDDGSRQTVRLAAPLVFLTEELGEDLPAAFGRETRPAGTETEALCRYIRIHGTVSNPALGRITVLGVYDYSLAKSVHIELLLPVLLLVILMIQLPRNRYRVRNMDGTFSKRYTRLSESTGPEY